MPCSIATTPRSKVLIMLQPRRRSGFRGAKAGRVSPAIRPRSITTFPSCCSRDGRAREQALAPRPPALRQSRRQARGTGRLVSHRHRSGSSRAPDLARSGDDMESPARPRRVRTPGCRRRSGVPPAAPSLLTVAMAPPPATRPQPALAEQPLYRCRHDKPDIPLTAKFQPSGGLSVTTTAFGPALTGVFWRILSEIGLTQPHYPAATKDRCIALTDSAGSVPVHSGAPQADDLRRASSRNSSGNRGRTASIGLPFRG
jgi:hypothetical protein